MDQRTIDIESTPPKNKMRISRLGRNKIKVLIAMFFAVVFGAFGDVSIRYGMRTVEEGKYACTYNHFVCGAVNPFVWIGVFLLILFFILYLVSLSWEELSYVLPLTAADYVLVTLLAYILLGEDVSPMRWVGSILVATGIALVVRT